MKHLTAKIVYILTAAVTVAMLSLGSIPVSYAAGGSEQSSGTRAVTIIVVITAFTAAFIGSAVLTYRIRMKSIDASKKDDDADSPEKQ